jgi:hypothetical protein
VARRHATGSQPLLRLGVSPHCLISFERAPVSIPMLSTSTAHRAKSMFMFNGWMGCCELCCWRALAGPGSDRRKLPGQADSSEAWQAPPGLLPHPAPATGVRSSSSRVQEASSSSGYFSEGGRDVTANTTEAGSEGGRRHVPPAESLDQPGRPRRRFKFESPPARPSRPSDRDVPPGMGRHGACSHCADPVTRSHGKAAFLTPLCVTRSR